MIKQIEGVNKLLKDLQSFGDDGRRVAVNITDATAETIANEAKLIAPVGKTKQLRLQTGFDKVKDKTITAYVFSKAPYAPYVNWGTGGLVSVTPFFKEYALEFKKPNVLNITIAPTGFLTIPYQYNAKKYPKDLEREFNILTKRYNNKK